MKCQILFSRKNKKNIISLWSAEFAHSIVSVKVTSLNSQFVRHFRYCIFPFQIS